MSPPDEVDSFGFPLKYSLGDTVRVWDVFGHPQGTVVGVDISNEKPVQWIVRYVYPDTGTVYEELFESAALTKI